MHLYSDAGSVKKRKWTCICHALSLIFDNPNMVDICTASAAVVKSLREMNVETMYEGYQMIFECLTCLLANTRSGIPSNFFSSSNSSNSTWLSSNLNSLFILYPYSFFYSPLDITCINYINNSMSSRIIITPIRPNGTLSSDIPHVESYSW